MANLSAGRGQQNHEVPSQPHQVVRMRDGSHYGTEVYLTQDGDYRFVSLDMNSVETAPRCVLVVLGDSVSVEDLSTPYACDLDGPGLALIGCDLGDDVPGEVLWDSHPTSATEERSESAAQDAR
jgi:hypothetical protein